LAIVPVTQIQDKFNISDFEILSDDGAENEEGNSVPELS